MDDIAGSYQLGPDSGRVLVKTGRAGLAAKAGHDLTLEITQWSAQVTVPADDAGDLTGAQVTADLDLGTLVVREGTGGAKPLSDKDRRDIETTARRILGGGTARFESSKVIPSGSGGAIEGTLTLHGTSRPLRLDVANPASGQYQGTFSIRQTEFGITPYSGFFGTLKLRDDIGVVVETDLSRASRTAA